MWCSNFENCQNVSENFTNIKTGKWKKMVRLKEINNVKTYHTVWCCFRRHRQNFLHCICKYPYPICENSLPLKSSLSQIAIELLFVFHIFHSIRAFHLDNRCRHFTYKLYSRWHWGDHNYFCQGSLKAHKFYELWVKQLDLIKSLK